MSLLDGLVSFWDLDELSGVRYDAFGPNHLTDNNTVGYTAGKVNNAANFVAANLEYLEITDAAQQGLKFGDSDFTIACWVKLATVSAYRFFITKSTDPSAYEYALDHTGSAYRFYCKNATTLTPVTGFGAATGAWAFVVGWHNSVANNVNLQVNNATPVSASHTGGCQATSAPVRLGAYGSSSGANFMDGAIDEIAVWNRVLTADEKTELYNGGAGICWGDLFKAGAVWL
jgi:hypothetical protein